MIIDEKTRNRLLKFNDEEDIYKQFERKCANLSRISGIRINPVYYKKQYETHEIKLNYFANIQNEIYKLIHKKYPEIDFGLSGRLKTISSHYEKIIRKFIDLFRKDEFRAVEILDIYAMKAFILSVNYPVDKISVDSNGIYIDSGCKEFRITEPVLLDATYTKNKLVTDAFEFDYQGRTITASVKEGKDNIFIEDNIPYISTLIDGAEAFLPLNSAKTYKRSCKDDIVPYCHEIQENIVKYLDSKGYSAKKKKDYITTPKKSGYSSLQSSFFSEEESLGIEFQIRTYDMELYNNEERKDGYKPNEGKLSNNSTDNTPRFVLTTKFPNGVHTRIMDKNDCFKYLYHTTIEEYNKTIKPIIEPEKPISSEKEETTR